MLRKCLLICLLLTTSHSVLADTAFDEALAKAKSGDAKAQTNLGWMYSKGKVVTKDDKQAVSWYTNRHGESVGNDDNAYTVWFTVPALQTATLCKSGTLCPDNSAIFIHPSSALLFNMLLP